MVNLILLVFFVAPPIIVAYFFYRWLPELVNFVNEAVDRKNDKLKMSSYLNCYVCKVCDPVCFFMSKTEPEQCPFKGYDECSFEQVSKEKSIETLNKMLEIVNGAAIQ